MQELAMSRRTRKAKLILVVQTAQNKCRQKNQWFLACLVPDLNHPVIVVRQKITHLKGYLDGVPMGRTEPIKFHSMLIPECSVRRHKVEEIAWHSPSDLRPALGLPAGGWETTRSERLNQFTSI